MEYSRKNLMHLAKYLCIFYAMYKTSAMQNSVVNFRKKSFFKKKQLKIYPGIFTNFSMQNRKFSVHVFHYHMQSENELWL